MVSTAKKKSLQIIINCRKNIGPDDFSLPKMIETKIKMKTRWKKLNRNKSLHYKCISPLALPGEFRIWSQQQCISIGGPVSSTELYWIRNWSGIHEQQRPLYRHLFINIAQDTHTYIHTTDRQWYARIVSSRFQINTMANIYECMEATRIANGCPTVAETHTYAMRQNKERDRGDTQQAKTPMRIAYVQLCWVNIVHRNWNRVSDVFPPLTANATFRESFYVKNSANFIGNKRNINSPTKSMRRNSISMIRMEWKSKR